MTQIALAIAICLIVSDKARGAKTWRTRRADRVRKTDEATRMRLVLMLVLVELRSGLSVLAALQSASERLPEDRILRRVARVASVSGLVASLPICDDPLRRLIAQLARASGSGGSVSEAIRRILDQDLAQYRSDRLARARAIPVKLMVPVTLLMLPGLVLALYAPSLIGTFSQLSLGL